MSLTRKFLMALGIETEKIDEIVNAHAETVDGLKEQLAKYEADAKTLPAVQKELDELKAKSTDKDYDKLKAEFDQYKQDVENEKMLNAKKEAFRAVAKDAGLSEKGIEKAIKYADWSTVELDDEGKVKDAKTHIGNLKQEWAEHIVTSKEVGAGVATPLKTGKGGMSKEQIMSIKDDKERQTAIAQNHELFGF